VTLGNKIKSQSSSYWRGGLGCPILQYLATAGVGTIGMLILIIRNSQSAPTDFIY
jgi:hypothetical protein